MDFLNRNAASQPQGVRTATSSTGSTAAPATNNPKDKRHLVVQPRWLRVALVVMLFSLTVVTIAVAFLLHKGNLNEANFVSEKKTQAVFLTNGQVYFGKVAAVNSQYLDLQDIYYLNTQSQSSQDNSDKDTEPTNFSLVKLGCELHGPADQMLINRDQVSFWENLKDDGQVAKAIAQFKQQNPNGQTCKTTTDSTQQSSTDTSTQKTSTDKKQ